MKKTLLVSAVAMAISGNAIAAEMYGQVRVGLSTYTAPKAGGVFTLDPKTGLVVGPSAGTPLGVDELDLVSGKLILGSKGSSDLGNGMTLSYQVELEHDQADQTGGVTVVDFDKSWVALSGGFGKVSAGRFADLGGWVCGGTDIFNFGTAEACELGHNTEYNNAIGYTGGSGALEFGVIIVNDGTSDDQDAQYGVKFSGGNFSVGVVASDNGTADTTATVFGGTYQLGNIGLGLTVGDDDSATDSGGVDFGITMPLGAGNLGVVFSTLDVDTGAKGTVSDGDSIDLEYIASIGSDGYYGIAYNSKDNWEEDRIIGYVGTNF